MLNVVNQIDPPSHRKCDHLFKLLIVGDSGVGKTEILRRYIDREFKHGHVSSIGIDFKIKLVDVETKFVKLQLWDTAGQERFRTITSAYYRGAHAIIFVFDVTNAKSFRNIQPWIMGATAGAPHDVLMYIFGNKSDMRTCREVSQEDFRELAAKYNLPFFEVSAQSGSYVDESFFSIAQELSRLAEVTVEQKVQLSKMTQREKEEAFHLTVATGDRGKCRLLLSLGVNVDCVHPITKRSALASAVVRADQYQCELLLSLGADQSRVDNITGESLLHLAVEFGYAIICQMLLARMQKTLTNSDYDKLFLIATVNERNDVCNILLKKRQASPTDALLLLASVVKRTKKLTMFCREVLCTIIRNIDKDVELKSDAVKTQQKEFEMKVAGTTHSVGLPVSEAMHIESDSREIFEAYRHIIAVLDVPLAVLDESTQHALSILLHSRFKSVQNHALVACIIYFLWGVDLPTQFLLDEVLLIRRPWSEGLVLATVPRFVEVYQTIHQLPNTFAIDRLLSLPHSDYQHFFGAGGIAQCLSILSTKPRNGQIMGLLGKFVHSNMFSRWLETTEIKTLRASVYLAELDPLNFIIGGDLLLVMDKSVCEIWMKSQQKTLQIYQFRFGVTHDRSPELIERLTSQFLDRETDVATMLERGCNFFKVLDLSFSQMEVVDERVFLFHGQLTSLDLSHNNLTYLPSAISVLSQLQVFNISHNKLSSICDEIGYLTKLEELDISHNMALDSLPGSVSNLRQIRMFCAAGCPIFSNLAVEIVEKKKGLALLEAVMLGNQDAQRVFRCKVLLAGEPYAGKTSLRMAITTSPTVVDVKWFGYRSCVMTLKGRSILLERAEKVWWTIIIDGASVACDGNVICLRYKAVGDQRNGRTLLKFKETAAALHWLEVLTFISSPTRTIGASIRYSPLEKPLSEFKNLREEFMIQRGHVDHRVQLMVWDLAGQEEYWAGHRLYLQRRSIYVVLWDVKTDPLGGKLLDWLLKIANVLLQEINYTESRPTGFHSAVFVVANKVENHSPLQQKELLHNAERITMEVFKNGPGLLFRFMCTSIHSHQVTGLNNIVGELFESAVQLNHMGEMAPWWLRRCEDVVSTICRSKGELLISIKVFWESVNKTREGNPEQKQLDFKLLLHSLQILQTWGQVIYLETAPNYLIVDPRLAIENAIGPLLRYPILQEEITGYRQCRISLADLQIYFSSLPAWRSSEPESIATLMKIFCHFQLLLPLSDTHTPDELKQSELFLIPFSLPIFMPTETLPLAFPMYMSGSHFQLFREAGSKIVPYCPKELPTLLFSCLLRAFSQQTVSPLVHISETALFLNTRICGCVVRSYVSIDEGTIVITADVQQRVFDPIICTSVFEAVIKTTRLLLKSNPILRTVESTLCIDCYSGEKNGIGLFEHLDNYQLLDEKIVVNCSQCSVARHAANIDKQGFWESVNVSTPSLIVISFADSKPNQEEPESERTKTDSEVVTNSYTMLQELQQNMDILISNTKSIVDAMSNV